MRSPQVNRSISMQLLVVAQPGFCGDRRRALVRLIFLLSTCGLLFLPWLWRGYLTSGYPFFPSTIGKLPLKVWIPKKTNQIYDAPLPATDANRFDPRSELRGEGLQDGFRIRGSGEAPWVEHFK